MKKIPVPILPAAAALVILLALTGFASRDVTLDPARGVQTAAAGSEEPTVAQAGNPTNPVMKAAMGSQGMYACPMLIAGTNVSVEKSGSNGALLFKTSGSVPELRERIQAMANRHNEMSARHAGMAGMQHDAMMSATAALEPIAGGARLVFTPKDPADLDNLQKELDRHAEFMSKHGACPQDMMQEPSTAMPANP